MIFAVDPMDATPRMIFYGLAVVCFTLSTIGYTRGKISFLGAGLALFTFPFFWDALAAS